MSAQRLSRKSIRRIEQATGLEIDRAWAHTNTGRQFIVLTLDGHRHGWYNTKTQEWYWDEKPTHFNTCKELT